MHIPVLKNEVLEFLDPKPNQNFIDATFGFGGHSELLLEMIKPQGRVLGIETDLVLYEKAKRKNIGRLILENGSYVNLKTIARKHNFKEINGILFDLGMSSWHLEQSSRGFSFLKNEPLDMRYSPKQNSLTAAEIINQWPPTAIERILEEYGEERFAKNITREIIKQRKLKPITTTFQLKEIVKKTVPEKKQTKIHPATKTFQALRIQVNNELGNIKQVLPEAFDILEPKARLVVISFHSLEDRIIKHFFKQKQEQGLLEILCKKPISPSPQELKQNPRARSAKLRAAIKK